MDPATLSAMIGVLANGIPALIQLFKKQPSNVWLEWSWDERIKYVEQGLLVATTAVLTGKATIIDDVMAPLIAHVDTGESYADWKRLNRYHIIPLMNEANRELDQARRILASGKSLNGYYFRYINLGMIENVKKQQSVSNNVMASLFSGNSIFVLLALAFAGFAYKKSVTDKRSFLPLSQKQLK